MQHNERSHSILKLKRKFFFMTILFVLFVGCVKDKDYDYNKTYEIALSSITFKFSATSIPADGNSLDTIIVNVLENDTKDSLNLSLLNISYSTSNGTFLNNGLAAINSTPSYKLDPVTMTKVLTDTIVLKSSTKADDANLTIKYLGTQQTKMIGFSVANPIKLKISASSKLVKPDFATTDTIVGQLSSLTGLPSQGVEVGVMAKNADFSQVLGIWRPEAGKINAAGTFTTIFVLGDAAINGIIYTGDVHLICFAPKFPFVGDTITVYSRQ